jgi:hypothetical protein
MSIGAMRMHRGLADRVPLCGPQIGIVDAKESFKTMVQSTSSSHPKYGEEGYSVRGILASIHLNPSEVRWFGGKQLDDDVCPGKEVV